jgi:competence protein ComEC
MGDVTEIDLLVISHAHQDHMNRLPEILGDYSVKRVIRTGVVRSVWWSSNTNEAINAMELAGTLEDINLADFSDIRDNPDEPSDLEKYFGQEFTYGESTITLVCGWNDLYKFSDVYTSSGDLYNSTSIVIRLDYHDRSILFAGDTNGYEEPDDPDDPDCITSEKYMFENSGGLIGCDVLIAGHHGSGGSSSRNFIDAVSPKYVVFSAGHYGIARSHYYHPNWLAARRFYESGVDINNIFRTDFGDNEGSPEWFYGRISDEIVVDPPGDDGVDIWLFPDRERDPYVCWERNDIDPHLRPDDFEF